MAPWPTATDPRSGSGSREFGAAGDEISERTAGNQDAAADI